MSNKTISINPKLFNMSKTKTRKINSKKQKVNIIPPNLFRNKILKRIQKHKQREIKHFSHSKTDKCINSDNEFTSSMSYLNDIVKQQKQQKQQKNRSSTLKNPSNHNKTNMNVNVDLPEELNELKPNVVVLNDVPYGILKKGNKPTYREYYNKTFKKKISPPNQITPANAITSDIVLFDVHKTDITNKLLNPSPSLTPPLPYNNPITETINLNKKTAKPKKISKTTTKIIKKKYTLGKNKDKRKVSVLIKNKKTQKQILNAYKDLKKKPFNEIKEYLYKHNLIKIGSSIPLDVGRQMYEAAKLTGNVINTNTENIIHNLDNTTN
jgi:hypothetical protein